MGHPEFGEVFPCACRDLAEEVRRRRRTYANLPHDREGDRPRTFDNFDPRRGTEKALESAREFALGRAEFRILTLVGPNGNGKSHLVEAIGRQMLNTGYMVKYAYSPALLDQFRDSYDEETPASFDRVWTAYRVAEVLLLDDVGQEKATEWVAEKLTRLVDERSREGKMLVVATRLTEEAMGQKLGPSLADRLFDIGTGEVKVVYLTAESYRTGRKWPPLARLWR